MQIYSVVGIFSKEKGWLFTKLIRYNIVYAYMSMVQRMGLFTNYCQLFQTRMFSSGGGIRQVETFGLDDSTTLVDRRPTTIRDHNKVFWSCWSLDSQPHGSRSMSPVIIKPSHPALSFIVFPHSMPRSPSSTASLCYPGWNKVQLSYSDTSVHCLSI